jgi:allantoinase
MVIFDPDAAFTVTGSIIHHRHKLTPYDNRKIYGVVRRTIMRGITIYRDGDFPAGPVGRPLLRSASGELQ